MTLTRVYRPPMKAFTCSRCGGPGARLTGDVNRALRAGKPLYCSRACWCAGAGETRRVNPVKDSPEGRAFKAEYDRRRRAEKGEEIRAAKRAAYRAAVESDAETVRAKQKAYRETHVDAHNAYCRQPAYVEKKRDYDIKRRAVLAFGEEWAEAALVLRDVEAEVDARMDWHDRAAVKGTQNKAQRRRREYEAAQRI